MNGAREGDARKEGSFPGGIYDVTLTGHWLKRLLAVVEVPCSQTAVEAEGQSVPVGGARYRARVLSTLIDSLLVMSNLIKVGLYGFLTNASKNTIQRAGIKFRGRFSDQPPPSDSRR